MTNRKQKSQNKSAKAVTILKKFWWLITIVLALVSWLVYSQVRSYVLDQRFNSTYEQLDSMGKALRSSLPIVNDGSDPIEKKCRENYYGFNSEIECGVYLTLYPSDKYDRYRGMENILQELLITNDFQNINLSSVSDKEKVEGTGLFSSRSDMRCGLYWGAESITSSKIIIDLYCREVVPNYLPGYTRE